MKRSEASKFVTETLDRLESVSWLTAEDLDRMRGFFSVRERLRAKILGALWDEFGPFDNELDED